MKPSETSATDPSLKLSPAKVCVVLTPDLVFLIDIDNSLPFLHVELVRLRQAAHPHPPTPLATPVSASAAAAHRVFWRTVPKSRLSDPNSAFTVQEIGQLGNCSDYESLLPTAEAEFFATHKLQKVRPTVPFSSSKTVS